MLLKNDFSWNWAIRIGWEVSAFRCWQFSPSSFFAQKNTTKKLIFLCVSVTDMNSSKKAIDFQVFFWIPGSLLRPPDVRIWNEITLKSTCFWNAQKLLKKVVILLRVKRSYKIRLTWGGVGPCILIKHPKKETHLDPCTFKGFLLLHLFYCFWKVGVLRIPNVMVLKMQKI